MKTPKEFALEQIAPYYKDPSTCGFENGGCRNITTDGRMCVAGKNYLPEAVDIEGSVTTVFNTLDNDQNKIFKPEVVGILSKNEWQIMQRIHDRIAEKIENSLECEIERLNLFTLEELKEYCETL